MLRPAALPWWFTSGEICRVLLLLARTLRVARPACLAVSVHQLLPQGVAVMQAKARAGTGRGVWLARGAVAVPYCCLYPVASRLGSVLSEQRYRHHLNTARCSPSPLSLYIHIPFDCRRGDGGDASRLDYSNTSARRCYLKHLYTELTLLAEQLGSRKVGQLHLLGSTFCYLE